MCFQLGNWSEDFNEILESPDGSIAPDMVDSDEVRSVAILKMLSYFKNISFTN